MTDSEQIGLIRPGQTVLAYSDAKLAALVRKHPSIPAGMEDIIVQWIKTTRGKSIPARSPVESVAEAASHIHPVRPEDRNPEKKTESLIVNSETAGF